VRALLSRQPGGPESLTLGDIELPPVPPRGHVRVAVRACAVNFPDVLMIADRYQVRPPRPFAPGLDVAGTVLAVGDGLADLRPGMRVMGQCRWGGMAQQADLRAAACVRIPDALAFDVAAAMLTTYGTARYALQECAALRAGETVLVLGAAGGVGLAAVEIAKAKGAHVVAAASSAAKTEVALRHGAAAAVVYPTGPLDREATRALAGQFAAACGRGGANVVVDVVGGDYTESALRAIAPDGRLLVVGFTAGIPMLPLNLVLLRRARVIGVAWSADLDVQSDWMRPQLRELIAHYVVGHIHPEITERYPLDQGATAIARLAARSAVGKIVIEV